MIHLLFVFLFHPVIIPVTMQNQDTTVGENVTFMCKGVPMNEINLVFKWYQNNVLVPSQSSSEITLRNVNRSMDGFIYKCEVVAQLRNATQQIVVGSGNATLMVRGN